MYKIIIILELADGKRHAVPVKTVEGPKDQTSHSITNEDPLHNEPVFICHPWIGRVDPLAVPSFP